jgi:hypothetical protein
MNSQKIIIHGVHRSGTSLTAALVAKMGAWYADDGETMLPGPDNIHGFYERVDVESINNAILLDCGMSWYSLRRSLPEHMEDELCQKYADRIHGIVASLDDHPVWFLKDPRFAFTWPLWKKSISGRPFHIIVLRHPISVARSLVARKQGTINSGVVFWAHQMLSILRQVKNEKNTCFVQFDGAAQQIFEMAETLNHYLRPVDGLTMLDDRTIEEIFSANSVHQKNLDFTPLERFPEIKLLWEHLSNDRFDVIDLDLQPSLTGLCLDDIEARSNSEQLLFQLKEQNKNIASSYENQVGAIKNQLNAVLEEQARGIHARVLGLRIHVARDQRNGSKGNE